jgi:hypothetical protein
MNDLLADIAGVDGARQRQAWVELQARFEADLEGTLAASESALEQALEAGNAHGAHALLAMLEGVTAHFPAVKVRADVLRLALARAIELGPSVALDAGRLLARSEPASLITPGLDYLIAVSDAHIDRTETRELWRALAEGDPASLPAIAESDLVTDFPKARAFFIEQLVALAKTIPHLSFDIAGSLATMGADAQQAAVAEQLRLQRVASALAAEVFEAAAETELPPPPDVATDPRVDALLEDVVARRSLEVLEPLMALAKAPSPAFVNGLCEAIAELREFPRDDETAGKLAYLSTLAVKSRPELAPARAAAELLKDRYLPADTTICLLSVVAHASARLVDMERALLCTLVNPSLAAMTDLWACVARERPEELIAFAGAWWELEGWDTDLGRMLSSELVQLAAHARQHAGAVVEMLEAQVVPEPAAGPGTIRLSIGRRPGDVLSRLRELLG